MRISTSNSIAGGNGWLGRCSAWLGSAAQLGLFLMSFGVGWKAQGDGVDTFWMDSTGSSRPESSISVAMNLGTNIFVLGRFDGYTNQIGATVLTNIAGVSNLFVTDFYGIASRQPVWAMTAVTEFPIVHAKNTANPFGNCIVCGAFGGTNLSFGGSSLANYGTNHDHSEDIFIANLNWWDGSLSWLVQMGGSGQDTFGDVAVDEDFMQSGFCLTGSFLSTNFAAGGSTITRISTNGADCFTAKYDFNGNLRWIRQGAYAAGRCIATDKSQNCYVSGKILGAATFDGLSPSNQLTDNFLAKYGPNGNLLWVRGDLPPVAQMVVDASQNIYIAGTFSNVVSIGGITLSNAAPSTIFLANCDTNGTPKWAQTISGWGYDEVRGLLVDQVGNLWLVGNFASVPQSGEPSNSVAIIAYYDAVGDLIANSEAAGTSASSATSIAGAVVNVNNSICVSGTFVTNIVFNGSGGLTNTSASDIYVSLNEAFPKLSASAQTTNFICTWPAMSSYYTLQVLTNLSGTWTAAGSGVMQNGKYVVTNAMTGKAQFFRLIANH